MMHFTKIIIKKKRRVLGIIKLSPIDGLYINKQKLRNNYLFILKENSEKNVLILFSSSRSHYLYLKS